jgi:protein DGCR14
MYLSAPYDEGQSLMHYVPNTEFKSRENPDEARRPPKSISQSATRVGKSFLFAQQKMSSLSKFGIPAMNVGGRGSSAVPESPKVNGFGFICTPSPCPGVDDEPLFTYGSVQGTPLLLAEDDCPGFNPFKVQQESVRERIGVELARKKAGGAGGARLGASKAHPGGVPSRPSTPGTPRLSEAARRLAKRAFGAVGDGVVPDQQLRASYRRSTTPLQALGRGPTPRSPATPRFCASPAVGPRDKTPRLSSGSRGVGSGPAAPAGEACAGASTKHLTDGLLEL